MTGKSRWLAAAALLILAAASARGQDEEAADSATGLTPRQPFEARAVELTLADKSVLRVYLADERIEVATQYGTLLVPAEDVLRIEFAQRLPEEIARLAEEKLNQLRDTDPDVQKAVGNELIAMREQSYIALTKAARSGDPAIAPQAAKVLERLKKAVPKQELAAVRVDDFLITADNKVAGQIAMPALRIRTVQFGELALKLPDARSLRHQSLIAPEAVAKEEANAQPDPGNLKSFEAQQGKVFAFTVTGAAGGGGIWGSDVYTTDSRLAIAAVHAGALKVGETGVVHVKIVPSPDSFTGSARNGVSTSPYGRYTAGYEFVKGDEEE